MASLKVVTVNIGIDKYKRDDGSIIDKYVHLFEWDEIESMVLATWREKQCERLMNIINQPDGAADIFFVQEMPKTKSDDLEKLCKAKQIDIYYSDKDPALKTITAVLVKHKLSPKSYPFIWEYGTRCCAITIGDNLAISWHGPYNRVTEAQRQTFLGILLDQANKSKNVIIGGDFNLKIERAEEVMYNPSYKSYNTKSYIASPGRKNIIDYFVLRNWKFGEVKVLPERDNPLKDVNNHDAVVAVISFPNVARELSEALSRRVESKLKLK